MNSLIIFCSKYERIFSPVVAPSSKKSALELILASESLGHGNDVDMMCAHFVAWCSRHANDHGFLSVYNLPEIPWAEHLRERSGWYERLMNELARQQPQPYLVNVDNLEITQGELVIWKPRHRHRIRVPSERELESTPPIPNLSLHGTCTLSDAIAALEGGESTTWCDGQFVRLANLTLCFAGVGGPHHGFQLPSPSEIVWMPTRLDYHPDDPWPWLPDSLRTWLHASPFHPLGRRQVHLRGSGEFGCDSTGEEGSSLLPRYKITSRVMEAIWKL